MEPKSLEDALRSLSKLLALMTGAIFLLSAYLVQRAAEIVVFNLDPLSPKLQLEQYGLKFSHLTLSVAWPIAVGIACAIFASMRGKRDEILAAIEKAGTDKKQTILRDPLYFTARTSSHQRLLSLLGWVPLISIFTVVAAQLLVTVMYSPAVRAFDKSNPLPGMFSFLPITWIVINVVIQLISASVGLSLAWAFGSNREFARATEEPKGDDEKLNDALQMASAAQTMESRS
jgi:hypothetical protein